jgi:guanylate kinase
MLGSLLVVSGPAGVGKGTVIRRAVEKSPNPVWLSVSATTRPPRANDAEGVTYYFKTKDEFKKMIANDELLEWAVYSDNFYGTPKKSVYDALDKGIDVVLEIEVQGALQMRAHHPEGIYVFIMPPSMEELQNRLSGRNTEDMAEIAKRMAIAENEMKSLHKYNYIIINEEIEKTAEDLIAILRADKLTRERYFNS